ncbi:hypothetical protein D9M71_160140 [compost metagenome]
MFVTEPDGNRAVALPLDPVGGLSILEMIEVLRFRRALLPAHTGGEPSPESSGLELHLGGGDKVRKIAGAVDDGAAEQPLEALGGLVPFGQADGIADLHRHAQVDPGVVQQLAATDVDDRIGQGATVVETSEVARFEDRIRMDAQDLGRVPHVDLEEAAVSAISLVAR